MSNRYPQGVISKNVPISNAGGNNVTGVYSVNDLTTDAVLYGMQCQRSLRFRASASAYLNRTPASAGNQQKWTWSGWCKRGTLSSYQMLFVAGTGSTNYCNLYWDATANRIEFYNTNSAANSGYFLTTNIAYRDPSAWYHVVLAVDTTAAAGNRARLYVNGAQVNWTVNTDLALNYNTWVNSANTHQIAKDLTGASQYLDGYLAEVNFVDGQALDPTYFGQYGISTGVWQPKKYQGTFGTNGFYLPFSNNTSTTTIGYDFSGNNNNWTTNNISLTAGSTYDSMIDVPTNWGCSATTQARGNYCVMNAVSVGADCTLSDGNLGVSYGSSGTRYSTMGTMGMDSGKWYFEFAYTSGGGGTVAPAIGISNNPSGTALLNYPGYNANGWSYVSSDGYKYNNGGSAYGATWTTNDVIGVAFDATTGTLTFYKNGASQGTAFSGLASGTYYPAIGDGSGTATFTGWLNFGQRPFSYTPPSGYVPLCTQNLPIPTTQAGNQYFDATVFSAAGSSQSVVNAGGFQPDFLWLKDRTSASNHYLIDSLRGVSNLLYSNATAAEGSAPAFVTAFNTNGFQLNTNAVYTNGDSIVGWQWKAGNTSAVNTAGSITSQVSANTTAGFSVVTYTGTGANATVGHGLGVAPSMMIFKVRSTTNSWLTYHVSVGATAYLLLDSTAASVTSALAFNNTAPTSSVFTISTGNAVNQSSQTYVAYCFAAIAGYSAFGSYTGNGSADGPFVYTGFRPRFILIKRTDTATFPWFIYDTSRSIYNVITAELYPNDSAAEVNTSNDLDIISNGFKLRIAANALNASGGTYIFAAFAENPFKYSLAR